MVIDLKLRIPSEARKWDNINKRWIVTAEYGVVCARLAEAYLSVQVPVPTATATPVTETRLLKLEYLGRCKARDNGEASASGYVDGSWSTVWPESVLREWFSAVPQRPNEKPTYFAVLGIKQSAGIDEVRAAYRRLAKQWHPDANRHDPDAPDVFKAITTAYQVLTNEALRRKYLAGLQFEASARQAVRTSIWSEPAQQQDENGYRAPLKCGFVLCEGQETLGRFVVSRILQFEDIVNGQGKVMVVSWPRGADTFAVSWQ
jgi:DnaJ-domain-containing protein 1